MPGIVRDERGGKEDERNAFSALQGLRLGDSYVNKF